MRNWIKYFALIVFVVFGFGVCLTACGGETELRNEDPLESDETEEPSEEPSSTISFSETEENVIDIYLLGGQSNAAGYADPSTVENSQTFDNVLYAGMVNMDFRTNTAQRSWMDEFVTVTTGLGRTTSHIGMEYGMASYLNDLYTEEHPALIFKTASGGTSLRDAYTNETYRFGNWLPPSLRTGTSSYDYRGALYDLFIENFTSVYLTLVEQGYHPNIVGMAWMQGETDRYQYEQYGTLIRAFISDLRSDLSEITGDNYSCLPFVMGEISETYSSYSTKEYNDLFNEAIGLVADEDEYVEVIASGQYWICDEDETILGTDKSHWSGADTVTIGSMFAEKIVQSAGIVLADGDSDVYECDGGYAICIYTEGVVYIQITANDGFEIKRVVVKDLFVYVNSNGMCRVAAENDIFVKVAFGKITS